jgi:hypothetical protein
MHPSAASVSKIGKKMISWDHGLRYSDCRRSHNLVLEALCANYLKAGGICLVYPLVQLASCAHGGRQEASLGAQVGHKKATVRTIGSLLRSYQ